MTIGKKLISYFLRVATITVLLGLAVAYIVHENKSLITGLGSVVTPSVENPLSIEQDAEIISA